LIYFYLCSYSQLYYNLSRSINLLLDIYLLTINVLTKNAEQMLHLQSISAKGQGLIPLGEFHGWRLSLMPMWLRTQYSLSLTRTTGFKICHNDFLNATTADLALPPIFIGMISLFNKWKFIALFLLLFHEFIQRQLEECIIHVLSHSWFWQLRRISCVN